MYSFAQRDDTSVVDEPLYGYYLNRTDKDHPGKSEIVSAMLLDAERIITEIILGHVDRDVLFVKTMAHHLDGIDLSFLKKTVNVILTRDPVEMLPSLVNQIPNPDVWDTGLPQQLELYNTLVGLDQEPPVLDSRELLLSPQNVLEQLCERIGIPFDSAMMSWPAGSREFDGVWAPYWYHNVHKSTGFAPYRKKDAPFPEHLEATLEKCQPIYEQLKKQCIKSRK